jgi:hypothetical protein
VLVRGARKMLLSLLQDPTNYTSHFQMLVATVYNESTLKLIFIRFLASFILSTVYDYQPESKDDHIVHVMQKYIQLSVDCLGLGAIMVMETFPFRMSTPAQYCLVINLNELPQS